MDSGFESRVVYSELFLLTSIEPCLVFGFEKGLVQRHPGYSHGPNGGVFAQQRRILP